MAENVCIKCHEHKGKDAIGTCALCGHGYCSVCRSFIEGRAACSVCAAKFYNIPLGQIKTELAEGPVTGITQDTISRGTAVVLLLLCTVTYIPLLVHWDKGRSTFIGLLILAIVSIGFQVALILRNNAWVWWGCFLLWIVDMVVTNIVYFHSLEPSGALSLIVLFFFFPFVIGALVWINYRSEP